MIAYGDPQVVVEIGRLISELRAEAQQKQPRPLDDLRSLLIRVGQLEQGIADLSSPPERTTLELAERATDLAAAAFYSAFAENDVAIANGLSEIDAALDALSRVQATFPRLTLKVPEGFAFYSLYPEQYCISAQTWISRVHPQGSVAVVGIRSIGTTLSAVVAAAFRANGIDTHRFTIRPAGHPFERTATIDPQQVRDARFAIVVDEGPGLSGSSMASVAEALIRSGIQPDHIAFFPAHDSQPGPAASATVAHRWAETLRVVTPLDQVRWRHSSLTEALCERTRSLTGVEPRALHDVSGGAWRSFAYGRDQQWPAAFSRFERAKYLVELADGRRVFWKFDDLSSEPSNRASAQAPATESEIKPIEPIDTFRGFIALPWKTGERLQSTDATEPFIRSLARWIWESSFPAASPGERMADIERITEMLCWNAKEAIGDEAGQRSGELAKAAHSFVRETEIRSFGDGHLAPSEFIRTPDGTIFKPRRFHPHLSHTIEGRQSILWDVAGVIVEWNLSESHVSALTGEPLCPSVPPDVLQFYCAAYAALRLAVSRLCVDISADAERNQLQSAVTHYASALRRHLLDKAGETISQDMGVLED